MGQRRRTINYRIERLAEAETEATGYTHRYKSVTLPPGVWNYDAIVDALVDNEYPRDRMDAVVNNYLAALAHEAAGLTTDASIPEPDGPLTDAGGEASDTQASDGIRGEASSVADHLAEFSAMQSWRRQAKLLARKLLGGGG